MSTRYIASPGVQISEVDQSLSVRAQVGTNIFMTGFASKGPTEEIINVSSVSDFESTFGTPTNEAERYLYHSARQVLVQSPGNLLVTRMPYGSASGSGYADTYSALLYPISASADFTVYVPYTTASTNVDGSLVSNVPVITSSRVPKTSSVYYEYVLQTGRVYIPRDYPGDIPGISTSLTGTYQTLLTAVSTSTSLVPLSYDQADTYTVGEPESVILNEQQYFDFSTGSVTWPDRYKATGSITAGAGIVILNTAKTSVNDKFEGYYVGFADNSNNNPATNFDAITGIKAANQITTLPTNTAVNIQNFITIPNSRLNFQLATDKDSKAGSISQLIEQFPTNYDFGASSYNDSLTLMYFKIRTSTYAQDTIRLDYIPQEGFTGSLNAYRTQNSTSGGGAVTFSLENVVSRASRDLQMYVNPYISSENGTWIDDAGKLTKKVRIASNAKSLYSSGTFVKTKTTGPELGNMTKKLERILTHLDDLDTQIDIIAEAGLGTIYAQSKSRTKALGLTGVYYFDSGTPVSQTELDELKTQSEDVNSSLLTDYTAIVSQFQTFAEKTRKDHMFIADPLRCIFLNGADGPNVKVTKRPGFNFSSDIYWSLKNLYRGIVSSYGAAYANWVKYTDSASNSQVWLPMSGYAAADIALSTATNYPWSAPAGFSRGTLSNVLDLAINPTMKQRDYLYKINLNPVAYFPGDGYVIFGQKTLFNKPSAFDRINVRRLFLTLEKATERLLRYFVFEPNTYVTRTRLVNTLRPLFDQAKNTDGLYDYRIICNETNNTPMVIDDNTLKIAIYIQPVRTAEFILADFVATRTGSSFTEITS